MKVFTATLALLLVVTIGALPLSHAQQKVIQGTQITIENSVTVQELIRIADSLDTAVDRKDWKAARELFTEQIEVDFSSLVGGKPSSIPADGLIQGWSNNLKASKLSFHMRSNHSVLFRDSHNATMTSSGYAWNRMEEGALPENGGDALWEVWGNYEHKFVKTADGWKISAMTFNMVAERGNAFVRNTVPES
ncbi:nuclear transport factor 2 family protein [Aliiglaciecola sp. M165]|uniref:nuclear transport factor 2 family protein n=1 Tax=Aliiglaciecola sp. M165 TaxID=2593649 RepID=UPI00117EC4BD|nr:nuclear transport factor 2 family protein [Aliiglaciecola sp. M165]TRY33206.1 nuclear transport factor 2 family protein [Aliiglaciecola sp. M165]